MKYSILVGFLMLGLSMFAQKKAEITFEVSGVCGMCEDRIEKSLDISGVIMADWDRKTKDLTVVYKTNKLSETQIHQRVADAGHDTEKVKATDEVYANLHGCCKYRDGASCSGEAEDEHDH